MQFLFGRMGVGCHTLALRIGEGVGLQACQGQMAVVFTQGRGDGTDQPVFEGPRSPCRPLSIRGVFLQNLILARVSCFLRTQNQKGVADAMIEA
jgi:hypothetical protein